MRLSPQIRSPYPTKRRLRSEAAAEEIAPTKPQTASHGLQFCRLTETQRRFGCLMKRLEPKSMPCQYMEQATRLWLVYAAGCN